MRSIDIQNKAIKSRLESATVAELALVTLSALTLLAFALSDASPVDMSDIVDGYTQCRADEYRVSECMLEYDGDGSSNAPSDWHWYWQSQSTEYHVLSPEQTVLLWDGA